MNLPTRAVETRLMTFLARILFRIWLRANNAVTIATCLQEAFITPVATRKRVLSVVVK
jgi:hypothetical protein